MNDYLPKEVLTALHAGPVARRAKRNRLVVEAGGKRHPVLRLWDTGFSVSADTPRLRGTVDLFDAAHHLKRCLILAASEENGVLQYEFKRTSAGSATQPLDYVRKTEAPACYLGVDPEL